MEQFNAILDKLQPLLNVQSPNLILLSKIIIVVIGTHLAWLILKRIFTTVEKRINKNEFIQINTQIFQLIRKAKDPIIGVAQTAEWIAAKPQPKVVVINFGESSVDLQLRVWIGNARKRMDTISYITDKVKEVFDKEGVEIPYPKRDIYVHQIDMQK